MRRADRLFQIVQRLRRRNTVVTAAALAGELEVSERQPLPRHLRPRRIGYAHHRRGGWATGSRGGIPTCRP